MSPKSGGYDAEAATERLLDSLRQLDITDVDLLLENLPPFPWYFGGRWFGHILTDSVNTERVCQESGLGLCFDTSHAALQCHRSGESLTDYARRIVPYLRHLHVSDAAGTSGEGLQIGEGQVNFVELMPILMKAHPTMIPEIWMGHHEQGAGFQTALEHLLDIVWAGGVLFQKKGHPRLKPELQQLVVSPETTLFTTLKTIDENRLGIAFVVDAQEVVVGVVTDGDIRHGLVQGKNLHSPVTEVMTRSFVYATPQMDAEEVQNILPGRTKVVPIIDGSRKLAGYATGLAFEDDREGYPSFGLAHS
jgi:hypothetical protein